MLKSTVVLMLIRCIGSQEILKNARCNHYPSRGTCEDRGFTIKWYYDRYAHRCRKFHYGGCNGNENQFDSFEECSQACRYEPSDKPSKRCALPHDPGTCTGNFERWHFDARMRRCICSWWSGCGGNSNMFYSYAHCMSICGIYADNRTSASGMTFRQFTPKRKNNKLNEVVSPREGRQYHNLFAASSSHNNGREVQRNRLKQRKPLLGQRLRPISVQNNQQQGARLAKEEARRKYNIHAIARTRDYMPEISEQRGKIVQERQQLQRQSWSDRVNEPRKDSQDNQPADPSQLQQQQHQMSSYQTSYSDKMQASEVPKTLRNAVNIKAELSRSAVNQLSDKKNWHRNQVQPKGVPFEMTVVTADRVPDRQNIHVLETISTISSPIEDFDQQKQIITIENYEDENYTYDQETENEGQRSLFSAYTPAKFAKDRWTVTIAVQPNSSSFTSYSTGNSTDLFTDMPKIETVTAVATTMEKEEESETENDMIEIIPAIHNDEVDDMNVLKDRNDIEDDDEIMFWRGQR